MYIINKSWFEKWKKFTRYPTLKRIMKLYNIYESRPRIFQPDLATYPGEINNKELMIRYNINNNDGRNILVSKNNDSLDTRKMLKKDFKIISKARFDLLNDLYKCDHILKGKRISDKDKISYEAFSVHLNIAFIPTLESFKEINDENYEDFKKKHEVIYDLYFKQNSSKKKIEIVTGYSQNSFEIYKLKNNEYIPIKDDVNNLEDFLKGENRIYLFQIPPYVFGKANDFFDKIQEKLSKNNEWYCPKCKNHQLADKKKWKFIQ